MSNMPNYPQGQEFQGQQQQAFQPYPPQQPYYQSVTNQSQPIPNQYQSGPQYQAYPSQPQIVMVAPAPYDATRQEGLSKASSAQIFGILSLFFFHVIFGIVAIVKAKDSAHALKYETSAAKTGKVCGIIGIILAPIEFIIGFFFFILFF